MIKRTEGKEVKITFNTADPTDAKVEIDGKVVETAYNLHLYMDPYHSDLVIQRYVTKNGGLVPDENGDPKTETIHLEG